MTTAHPPPSPDNPPAPSSGEASGAGQPTADVVRSPSHLTGQTLRAQFTEACHAWLSKSPSKDTRTNYARDVAQFLRFVGADPSHLEVLATVRPAQVAAWRDRLLQKGLENSSVVRKMSAVRALYSYLQSYGYTGVNPAHTDRRPDLGEFH